MVRSCASGQKLYGSGWACSEVMWQWMGVIRRAWSEVMWQWMGMDRSHVGVDGRGQKLHGSGWAWSEILREWMGVDEVNTIVS